jgi:hypothetical protein
MAASAVLLQHVRGRRSIGKEAMHARSSGTYAEVQGVLGPILGKSLTKEANEKS